MRWPACASALVSSSVPGVRDDPDITVVADPLRSRLLSKPENRYRSCKSGSHLSWLRMIKRAVKKILEATGFELRRININHKFEREREDKFKWIRNLNIRTVLDVGANTGQFAGEIHAILPEA